MPTSTGAAVTVFAYVHVALVTPQPSCIVDRRFIHLIHLIRLMERDQVISRLVTCAHVGIASIHVGNLRRSSFEIHSV